MKLQPNDVLKELSVENYKWLIISYTYAINVLMHGYKIRYH